MVVKEYYQNINVHRPRDYFERWYADVWQRRVGKSISPPGQLQPILEAELDKYDATLAEKDNGYKFIVTFHNDRAYTIFALRWS